MRTILVILSCLLLSTPAIADQSVKPANGKKYQWFHPWFKTTITSDTPPTWPYRVIEKRANVIILEVTPPVVKEESPPKPAKPVPTYTNADVPSYTGGSSAATNNSTYSAPTPAPVAQTGQQQSSGWRVAEAGAGGVAVAVGVSIIIGILMLVWWALKTAFTAARNSDTVQKAGRFVKETTSVVSDSLSTPEYNAQTYSQALQEIESGTTDRGLWAKALVSANGDEGKAKAAYIKYRVKALASG